MKKLFMILVLGMGLLPAVSGQAATDSVYLFCYFKGNGEDGLHLAYSKDALNWTSLKGDSSCLRPTVAKDKLMRDPCIIRGVDGKFHMVWTVSWTDKGIGYASSADLIHWSEQQFIPVMMHEPTVKNTWAPELFYDAGSKKYMIYWASTIPGKFPATDTLGDQKYNHRIYYTTTQDFTAFSKTELLYDQGFNVIDATIQNYGKGKYIMFLKDETLKPVQKNIRYALSNNPFKGWSKPSAPVTGQYWAEGPTAVAAGKRWIVYFDKYRDHTYGAIASEDLQTWTDISAQVSMPHGVRHGTVFTVTQAEFDQLAGHLK
jgi:hypothetical protein